MKWVLIILGVLAALIALMWLIGSRLPQGHIATRIARYQQPPQKIWQAITDVDAMPTWRADLKSLKRLPDKTGLPAWVETSGMGEIPIEVTESTPPRRLVTRIADPSLRVASKIADPKLPFEGTWTYEIEPAEGGCTLRITERGEIYPAMFRFMARFFFGYTSTMEQYLKSLGKKFGETVEPQS